VRKGNGERGNEGTRGQKDVDREPWMGSV